MNLNNGLILNLNRYSVKTWSDSHLMSLAIASVLMDQITWICLEHQFDRSRFTVNFSTNVYSDLSVEAQQEIISRLGEECIREINEAIKRFVRTAVPGLILNSPSLTSRLNFTFSQCQIDTYIINHIYFEQ